MTTSIAGPSGGFGGNDFSDAASIADGVDVAALEVRAGAVIDAVMFVYRHGSTDVGTERHGGDGGSPLRLELHAGEQITRLRGTYGFFPGFGYVVHSIVVDTNQRENALRAGGSPAGAAFVYEAGPGREIAGLTGASGTLVDALGVITRSRSQPGAAAHFRLGPSGGDGGQGFNGESEIGRSPDVHLARIVVHGDRFVDSISTQYVTPDGRISGGARHGGDGGDPRELDLAPGEFVTAISGRFGTLLDRIVIDTNRRKEALAIGANFRVLEPRSPFPAAYRYEAPEGAEIIGFFGRSGTFIDALGVICRLRP
jgi:hypothetical protein